VLTTRRKVKLKSALYSTHSNSSC